MQSIISDGFTFDFPCLYRTVCPFSKNHTSFISLFISQSLFTVFGELVLLYTLSLSCSRFVGELVDGIGGCGVMWHMLFAGVLTAPRGDRYKERERKKGERWIGEKERQKRTPNLNGIEWKLRTHAKMWAVRGVNRQRWAETERKRV